MCDENTQADIERGEAARGLSRRDFGLVGTAAAVMATYGSEALAAGPALTEGTVMIPTQDGTCDAFFVRPAKGKHPGVILWPDIAGLREAKKVMARRLAAQGYAVLAVNHYYRGGKAPFLKTISEWMTPEGKARLAPLIAGVSPETNMRDAKAFVAWLDKQKSVDSKRGIGAQGYCMTGSWAIRTAVAAPARVLAVGSFHGGGVATDKPDSPSKMIGQTKARYLIAIAKNDDARDPAAKDIFKADAAAAGRPAEVEVYQGDHGWTVPDSPTYNQAEADRAFARLLALYAKL
ncbi:dienelactone hydrolase family protein [Novosphingobium flavum]|uniref:Dienelactone hydrolase family protein n=1 Tax=Novosphingobium flavum TaxID=1778672 RepID=A0A7X1FU99_9SPHN|nr:dienelactone hydrolase family protein [Novosphingobium flavum]MBC2666954.1 dienelactone hydrolase family protein [Novosphingobium flavum]